MNRPRFYFDFLSPYSYFAWVQLGDDREAFDLVPVLLGALLDAHGTSGPAEIPAKRHMLIRDCMRIAARLSVPFSFPAKHPFMPLPALRLALVEVAGDRQADVIDAIWRAGWQHNRDLADEAVLTEVLDAIGVDGRALVQRTRDDDVKAALRRNTEQAIKAGVFGVPTFHLGDELIWGSDRMADVRHLLAGPSHLDEDQFKAIAATPVGLVRGKRTEERPDPARAAERVRHIFSAAPFMTALGVELNDVSTGRVGSRMDVRDDHLQQDGFVHAGVVASLADHSAGAAAGSMMPKGKTPLTIEYKVNMLRPALGPSLRCAARVLKPGRTIFVAEAEVYDVRADEEKLVAKSTVTLAVVDG